MSKKASNKNEQQKRFQSVSESLRETGPFVDFLEILKKLRGKKVTIANSVSPSSPKEILIKDVEKYYSMVDYKYYLRFSTSLGSIDLNFPQVIFEKGNEFILDYRKSKDSEKDLSGKAALRKTPNGKYAKVKVEEDLLITIRVI